MIPAPLRIRDFRTYWLARLASTIAQMAMVIVIGWQVYDMSRETMGIRDAAFQLGLIGLVQFVPLFVLTPVSGWAADRLDRRHIARAVACVGRPVRADPVRRDLGRLRQPSDPVRCGGTARRGSSLRRPSAGSTRPQPRASRNPAQRHRLEFCRVADAAPSRGRRSAAFSTTSSRTCPTPSARFFSHSRPSACSPSSRSSAPP